MTPEQIARWKALDGTVIATAEIELVEDCDGVPLAAGPGKGEVGTLVVPWGLGPFPSRESVYGPSDAA